MARPSVTHDGFLIPNAGDVVNPRMAEPDRIDFNTLANAGYGVVTGCLVTVSGATASTLGGVALVAGLRVEVASQSLSLASGGSLDRFDIIAVNAAGTMVVVGGVPATDPVFPDPGLGFTTLAAVFAAASTSNFADTVIDKRTFRPQTLLTTNVTGGDVLVQSKAVGSSAAFTIFGNGRLEWTGGPAIVNSGAGINVTAAPLTVSGGITAGVAGMSTSGPVTAVGNVQGANLLINSVLPGSAAPGTIFANSGNGKIYVRQGGVWQEIATLAGAVPPGTMIDSVRPPSEMTPLGWVPLDGRTVQESEYPSLFTMTLGSVTGIAPNRSMVLPNMTDRVRRTSWGTPGQFGGSNTKSLVLDNMPPHIHNVVTQAGGGGPISVNIGQGGVHSHPVEGGEHSHPVNDPGHRHNGMEGPTGTNSDVVALFWGGRNKIDALFNDRNHTFSVENLQWTMPALTGITVSSVGSAHGHVLGDHLGHTHPSTVSDAPVHTHPVVEQSRGLGSPFDVSSAYMTVYTYLRS